VLENWKCGHWSVQGCSLGGESKCPSLLLACVPTMMTMFYSLDATMDWFVGCNWVLIISPLLPINLWLAKETSDMMMVDEELKWTTVTTMNYCQKWDHHCHPPTTNLKF
jgi:hypothetical protein